VAQNSAAQFNPAQHMVELFESTETLVDAVSAFLSDGLNHGDHVLVVMRLAQWNSVASKLTSRNVLLSDAIASGRLTVFDGTRTLARIMLHGAPCRGLFEEVVGRTVRQICASGIRVRVYADLVDVLAADGNFHGAHELEKMWSDLTTEEPVTVLCGYSAATFYSPDAVDTLRTICRSHTDIRSSRLPVAPMPLARLDS